jgi:hypothetical protein
LTSITGGYHNMESDHTRKFTYGQKVMVQRYVTSDMYHRAVCLGPGHTFRTGDDMLMSSQPIPSLRVRFDDGIIEDVDYSRVRDH